MLIPTGELKLLDARAIRAVAWIHRDPRPLPSGLPHQAGFVFGDERREFVLCFDAVRSPEVMSLRVAVACAGIPPERLRRAALRLNAECLGVKFWPVDAAFPQLICSVEAILAADGRLPHQEVAEAVLRAAMRRLEEAADRAEETLAPG